ncbi:MAG: hypothetical protein IJ333_04690 [Clostridia bacterium]|nr:hypothetical protein [Clostridia bacterium]
MFHQGYFKGWYFKCCAKEKTIAFIPAYHRSDHRETVSLQIITDEAVFHIPFDSLEYREKPLWVKLGECLFSENGISLNLRNDKITVDGSLRFSRLSPIQYDIMGPFRYVPFMQCRHAVYSMKHRISGQIILNGQQIDFQNGIGYIEGDRGSSFPKQYIWTQCCFENGSLMLSVADIPLLGGHFTGIIGIILLDGKEYRIATYLGAKVKRLEKNTVTVEQGEYQLTVTLMEKNAQPLYAPVGGKMSRTIHESASCKAHYQFLRKGKILCEISSNRASFEFEYA